VADNHSLTRRLMQMQEEEREYLARELHDEIGQCVTAIHADAVAIGHHGGEHSEHAAALICLIAAMRAQIECTLCAHRLPP